MSIRNLWMECDGAKHIVPFAKNAFRVIEQDILATRKLVDSLEEQTLLEELIEGSKPPSTIKHLHPLLHTPFRYPPLKYGSRFGKKIEPSLWYGALSIPTALAEKAFYQFHFLRASEANFGTIEISLTAFSISIKTNLGINLIDHPFSNYTHLISSPDSYEVSQTLGSAMRNADIQAFIYQSARDPELGANIALFNQLAFLHSSPDKASFQSWQCLTHHHVTEFIRTNSITKEFFRFDIKKFFQNEVLPFPAVF